MNFNICIVAAAFVFVFELSSEAFGNPLGKEPDSFIEQESDNRAKRETQES